MERGINTILHKFFQKVEAEETFSNGLPEDGITKTRDFGTKESHRLITLTKIDRKIFNKIPANRI